MERRKKAQLEEARRIANVGESPYTVEEVPSTDGPALGGIFAESQQQLQPEQTPETPRARGWGLSNFLPSARSVTKYIPFSSRLTISTPQQPPPPQPQELAQTEPRINVDNSQPQADPNIANTVIGPGHRRHQSTSKQQRLLTKEQADEERRIKKMRAQMRREAEALEEQRKDLEIAKKDLAEQRKLADTAQTPGQKRKRIPSPDVIPLPPNGGFGLVDEYFIAESSSDEEDAAAQETPTKERPLKIARTSTSDDAVIASPFRARPYTGTLFAHPDSSRSRQDDNVFVELDRPDANPALASTPAHGPTLTFKVPSPGSSDSDSGEDEDDGQQQNNQKTQRASSPSVTEPKSILRNSNQSQSRSNSNSSSPSKTMVPPPRPNTGHTNLSAATTMPPSGALEKAREKALKHQPKQPSTLRESSRLSTSTVNPDVGDPENVEEYDPAHPAIITSPSKVPVFGQSATPAASAFGQPAVSSAAPTAFQPPIIEGVSERQKVQPVLPNVSEQQTETLQTDILDAHNHIQSNGQQAVSAKKSDDFLSDTDRYLANRNPKIKADMDRYWEEHGDDFTLSDGYKEFEDDMIAEEQELMEGPNGFPYKQPHNIISSAFDRIGADSLADRGIQTEIEENWRPEDLERTESDPANGMRVFFNRLVKNGGIERDLADRVIAIGVPPGITEYLAGQGVAGPMAA